MTSGGVAAVVVLGLAFLLLSVGPLWHTDFWVHLKYGEWIASHHTLPDRESLSPFMDKDAPFFDPQWLSQLGYQALFRVGASLAGGDDRSRLEGGVEVIRLAHLCTAIATVGLLGLAYRRASGSAGWAVGAMVMVIVLMLSSFAVQRPQALALICFAAILCGLSRPIPTRRAVVWIPLACALWVNLHGSFPVGLGLVGAALVGRVAQVVWAAGYSAVRRDAATRRLGLMLLLCLAATVINPYGPSVYPRLATFATHPNLRTMIEWQPMDFGSLRGGQWVYLATAALVIITPLATRRMYSPTQLVVIVAFAVWPLFHQRALNWWLPLVPWAVTPLWATANWRSQPTALASGASFRKTAIAAVLVAFVAVVSPASGWIKSGRPRPLSASLHRGTPNDIAAVLAGRPAVDETRVVGLARVVKEWYGGRLTGAVFASETQGEYLLWALPPDTPVMMCNHAQAYRPDYWNACLAIKRAAPGWAEALAENRVGVVVVETDFHPDLCAALRNQREWRVVVDETGVPARDPYARLFVAVRVPQANAGTE
ncbi:hypothetical protein FRUB_09407 [Fimbriiglobus ruber]|uniref:Glycosyltransferase RgtA/B/C/D-like domain-containing protein n=2 Tax=Fimbriiglobus ruber TaxID=1908690 RepID=A0A225DD45_9BACT|nr:hypothetical protein FRUB_09407 [Fimbriiglobus ruber]